MIRSTKRKRHKLSSELVGPMHIINMKSDSVYVVKDLKRMKQVIVHIWQMIPYPAQLGSSKNLAALPLDLGYLSSELQLVDLIQDVCIKDGEYDLLIKWKGWKWNENPGET